MKIYIDGSKRSAVSRMFPIWRSLGHRIANDPSQADVQLSVVRISNKSGLPTVLRLDGIYYDKATDYNKRNISISNSHCIASAVIYQSRTSKRMCERYLAPRKGMAKVIHNGINPNGWNNPIPHDEINIVACGKWRRPKRLEETIEVFTSFLNRYDTEEQKNITLHIVGGFKKGGKEIPHKNVIYHGVVDYDRMKEIYRTGDMFLHLCKKDSCPSTVVEAIASGMPVVTTNACGGATEMCVLTKDCIVVQGEPESLESDYIYQDKYNALPHKVKKNIVRAMEIIAKKRTRVSLPHELTIDFTAMQYLDIMKKIVK